MANEKSSSTKICPTCGTRLSADAARCLVCGTNLSTPEKESRPGKAVQGSRMPEVTLSLPLVIGLLALFLGIGAILVYVALGQAAAPAAEVTETPTVTLTTTSTLTPTPLTPTPSNTPEPTLTPLPYTVKLGDTCGSIAYAFKVSVLSIVLQNNLPADCSTLIEGQLLQVPQPTATATALPTATLNPQEATEEACLKDYYTVQENDTLGGISLNYNVPMESIREYNGLVSDVVRFGQQLVIPLCDRETYGPTATPTLPPPYPPVTLLLPPDGAAFILADDVATLQWTTVGVLRENEAYAVTIEDVTEGQGRKLLQYVLDTKFIVPVSFRSPDSAPHVYRWWVVTVRQAGTDDDGNPIWEPAGAVSGSRVFIWASTAQAGTPVP
ncbi:MAG: LysM peptidoglycan-binding domain-containing protein [Chloroflexota bacterium]